MLNVVSSVGKLLFDAPTHDDRWYYINIARKKSWIFCIWASFEELSWSSFHIFMDFHTQTQTISVISV